MVPRRRGIPPAITKSCRSQQLRVMSACPLSGGALISLLLPILSPDSLTFKEVPGTRRISCQALARLRHSPSRWAALGPLCSPAGEIREIPLDRGASRLTDMGGGAGRGMGRRPPWRPADFPEYPPGASGLPGGRGGEAPDPSGRGNILLDKIFSWEVLHLLQKLIIDKCAAKRRHGKSQRHP